MNAYDRSPTYLRVQCIIANTESGNEPKVPGSIAVSLGRIASRPPTATVPVATHGVGMPRMMEQPWGS